MTREEAIKCLKELPFLSLKSNSDWAVEKDINNQVAVRMAILALEQEPCEDAISRKAILECQYTIDESETLGISTRNVVNVDDILNAKPVQPKPKTER